MRFKLAHEVKFFETDPALRMKLGSLVKLLQEAAISHSGAVGQGARKVQETGFAWVLHKLGIDIFRCPEYGEELEIVTWSTGVKGLKARREFRVFAGDEAIITASSLWFYIDVARKQVVRIPPGIIDPYGIETETALQRDLDNWKADTDFLPEAEALITTRFSDYDPLEHVNNSVYFDYLETAIFRCFNRAARVKSVDMFFAKEISREIETISAGFKTAQASNSFKIWNSAQIFACGDFILDA